MNGERVDSDQFRIVMSLFQAASDLPPDRRAAFLAESCADAQLRREVESLLAVDAASDTAHGEQGEMPGQLGLGPHHLAVSPDGTVYTTEIPNLRVQKFMFQGSSPK